MSDHLPGLAAESHRRLHIHIHVVGVFPGFDPFIRRDQGIQANLFRRHILGSAKAR